MDTCTNNISDGNIIFTLVRNFILWENKIITLMVVVFFFFLSRLYAHIYVYNTSCIYMHVIGPSGFERFTHPAGAGRNTGGMERTPIFFFQGTLVQTRVTFERITRTL